MRNKGVIVVIRHCECVVFGAKCEAKFNKTLNLTMVLKLNGIPSFLLSFFCFEDSTFCGWSSKEAEVKVQGWTEEGGNKRLIYR
jgi:hypothetical protein